MTYPTTLDTAATLPSVANNLATTLTATYASPAVTLAVADATGIPSTGGTLYVGGERCTYTGTGTGTVTGISGLTNNYAAGTTVELLFDASHYNGLRDAVIAVETKVGITGSADANSMDYKLAQKPVLTGANPAALGIAAPGTASDAARSDHVHPTTGLELIANRANDLSTNDNAHYPTTAAVKAAIDSAVTGLLDDRGNYNASVNTYPAAGGSGATGAILKGDLWYISVAGTLGGTAVSVGDTLRALTDAPGQVAANWDIIIAPVSVAGQIHAAASKTTPADTDEIGMTDSAASWVIKKLTWANLKATLKTYFDGFYVGPSLPQNSKSAAYTTVLADANKHIFHPSSDTTARTWTIDSNANVAYDVGTALTFVNQNGAGVITIAITSDTLRLATTGTTGSRTLAANGIATALKIATTEWIISGPGLS